MNKLSLIILITSMCIILMSACDSVTDSGSTPDLKSGKDTLGQSSELTLSKATDSDIWVSAYLASWNHNAPPGGNWGNMSTSDIDWNAFTHMIYFAMSARSDGSLSTIADYENMAPDRIRAITEAGSENNTPVIISIGGWGNYDGFSGAIRSQNRARFISNLVELITVWGFDGIDLDMEPIRDTDVDNYKATVRDLHAALQQIDVPLTGKPLLTAALMGSHASLFAELHEYFDQINLMTYDYSGAWDGWVSWHNSPLFSGGNTFPNSTRQLPSTEQTLNSFLQAGVPARKLGIGIDFYGYVWNGQVDGPAQSWSTPPNVQDNVPYYTIMSDYYTNSNYNYDSEAVAAWIGISSSNASQRKFISYDDERVVREKIRYARDRGIGGAIIWELGGGFEANKPSGQRDVLLQAIKDELRNGNGGGSTPPPSDPGPNPGPDPDPNPGPDPDPNPGPDPDPNPNPGPDPDPGPSTTIFSDQLTSPWIDASWNASVNYNSSENNYAGNRSIKVDQQTWGALSVRKGDWGAGQDVQTSNFNSVQFAVYAQGQNASISVMFENDQGQSFPRVEAGTARAGQWTIISVPVRDLNPNGRQVHRLNIMEMSGANRTYFVDEIKLTGSDDDGGSTPPPADPGPNPDPDPGTNPGSSSSVFGDGLVSPWIDASWNATINFRSTERAHSGQRSIKVSQNAWGALSLHNGNWDAPVNLTNQGFDSVEFQVYATNPRTNISVRLENSNGDSFPTVNHGVVRRGRWITVTVPMSQLNPQNRTAHRLNITEVSGSSKTYFIDDIRFLSN